MSYFLLSWKICPEQYIGESHRSLQDWFADHRGYVNNRNLTKVTGLHFNQKGHKISDMEITILEKIYDSNGQFRKQRECGLTDSTPKKGNEPKNLMLIAFHFFNILCFHSGTEEFWCWFIFIVLSQSDDDHIKWLKYITDRILLALFCSGNFVQYSLKD